MLRGGGKDLEPHRYKPGDNQLVATGLSIDDSESARHHFDLQIGRINGILLSCEYGRWEVWITA